MLPYETDVHARRMFSRLLSSWHETNGALPSEQIAHRLASASLRMAQEFSSIANEQEQAVAKEGREQRSGVAVGAQDLTFEKVLRLWVRHWLSTCKKVDRNRIVNRFRRYLLPLIGSRHVDAVSPSDLVSALQAVEDKGHLALAHLILKDTVRLYRFAVASGYARGNPASELRGALYPWRPRHRATILVPQRVGELLRAIDTYHSYTTSKYFLRLMPLLFVRPSELREAEWSELSLANSEWRIPARRMKARRPHIVPLARQARAILRDVHRITGRHRYVFASERAENGVISVHLCTTMLKSIGFGGEITMTGFRSMASTLLSEQGWNPDAIERQLSHADPSRVRRTYNFAEYLPERRRMMQAWADYLDKLRKAKPLNDPTSRARGFAAAVGKFPAV